MRIVRPIIAVVAGLSVGGIVLWAAGGIPFKTSEEKIPAQVLEITRKQIQSYFTEKEFPGIPLLDPKIDWNDFKNWPDEFVFRGKTYHLRLVDTSGGDYFRDIKSRSGVKMGMTFYAVYNVQGTDFLDQILQVSADWTKPGWVTSKSVHLQQNTVFAYHYHSDGHLYLFQRNDPENKDFRREYFDREGKRVGGMYSVGGTSPPQYEWAGRKVDEETYMKQTANLYAQTFK